MTARVEASVASSDASCPHKQRRQRDPAHHASANGGVPPGGRPQRPEAVGKHNERSDVEQEHGGCGRASWRVTASGRWLRASVIQPPVIGDRLCHSLSHPPNAGVGRDQCVQSRQAQGSSQRVSSVAMNGASQGLHRKPNSRARASRGCSRLPTLARLKSFVGRLQAGESLLVASWPSRTSDHLAQSSRQAEQLATGMMCATRQVNGPVASASYVDRPPSICEDRTECERSASETHVTITFAELDGPVSAPKSPAIVTDARSAHPTSQSGHKRPQIERSR